MEVAVKFLLGLVIIIIICVLLNYYLRISLFWAVIISFCLIATWINMSINKLEICNWDCKQAELIRNAPDTKPRDFQEIIPKELRETLDKN